jgi:hypothetical protein
MADTATPSPVAPALPPAAVANTSAPTVNVRVPWPLTAFDPGIEGVDVITNDFTAIPASSLTAVQTAARKSAVTLIEEKS